MRITRSPIILPAVSDPAQSGVFLLPTIFT
jgi:hypothetical protein